MINKKLHYVGVGGAAIPKRVKEIMDNSKKVLGPKGTIKIGTEKDFDVNSNPFTKYWYKRKNWAFVSDYIRAYAVHKEGGWYTDTDIGLNKSLDTFLDHDYVASRTYIVENTMSIFGATKNNKILKTYMDTMSKPKLINKPPRIMSTDIHTYAIRKYYSVTDINENQYSNNILILKENILQINTDDQNVAIHEHHDNGKGRSNLSVSKYYEKKVKAFRSETPHTIKRRVNKRNRMMNKIEKLSK